MGTSSPRSAATPTLAVLCSVAGVLMQALDTTIANVALPYMQSSLSASRDQITWVLTSYIVASAVMTAPVGWMANRYGIKIVFVWALVGFTGSSILCGAAQSLTQMVAFRIAQGLFGAALTPLSLAVLLALYPPERRGQTMAVWGMGLMLGPILGPTLGGLLTEYYNWRWVFYVNVPIGCAAALGLWVSFKDVGVRSSGAFDWMGFAFLSIAVGSFQLMLDRGVGEDWFESTEIVIEAILAGLFSYLFVVHVVTAKAPFTPKALFVDRNFVLSMILMYALNIVLLASITLMSPFLQNLAGHPVLSTGLLLGPRGFGVMAAMFIAGKLSNRVDPRQLMSIGLGCILWALWDMAHWTPAIAGGMFLAMTILQGFGLGLAFSPLSVIAFATLPRPLQNDASSLVSLMRNLGCAAGISAVTAILNNSTQALHAELTAQVTLFNRAIDMNASSLLLNPRLPRGAAVLDAALRFRAAFLAYGNAYLFLFGISLTMIPLIWLFRRPAYSRSPKPAHPPRSGA